MHVPGANPPFGMKRTDPRSARSRRGGPDPRVLRPEQDLPADELARAATHAGPRGARAPVHAPARNAICRSWPPGTRLACPGRPGPTMRELADRVAKAVSDVTVGTVIVLVHVALAERERERRRLPPPTTGRDPRRAEMVAE